jgi:hypothetical protein
LRNSDKQTSKKVGFGFFSAGKDSAYSMTNEVFPLKLSIIAPGGGQFDCLIN